MTETAIHIALVVAVAENGVIGRDGRLPWRMPSDLKTFRRLTMGRPIVMGRRTFQSIGRALDGRLNIVVSRDRDFVAPGAEVVASLEDALARARSEAAATGADEIMIIGGGQIYAAAMHLADRIYLTRIHARPDGDAIFPDPPAEHWQIERRQPIEQGEHDEHAATLLVYGRRMP